MACLIPSISRLSLLALLLPSLLPPAFAAGPERGFRPPGSPSEHPPPNIGVQPHPVGSPPQEGPSPPFSNPESGDLHGLADKVKELIESIISLFPPSITSSSAHATLTAAASSTPDSSSNAAASSLAAVPTGEPNATLACEIYQAYTSICPPITIAPYTYTFLDKPYTVGPSGASEEADTSHASCLCYSASYYVPDVYDDAASACASYTTDPSHSASADATFAAAASAAAQTYRFCYSIGNVRPVPSATFGEFTATATSAATTSASPTGGGSSSAAESFFGVERGSWVRAAAAAVVAVLI